LEKVFVDLTGKQACVSATGNLYIMSIIDNYSGFPWAIPLKNKSSAFAALSAWKTIVEKETGEHIGTIQVDHGELDSDEMQTWAASHGIKLRFTSAHTSAQNGWVERLHRMIMNKARAMRIDSQLPAYLWDEFCITAAYLHARTSSRNSHPKSPFELYHLEKPNVAYLREIGCHAFVLILNKHNPKIYERSLECILIGYPKNSKAYRCYHRQSRWIIESYHVQFIESHNAKDTPSGMTGPNPSESIPTSTTEPEPTLDPLSE
jgi:hypothetical protein